MSNENVTVDYSSQVPGLEGKRNDMVCQEDASRSPKAEVTTIAQKNDEGVL